MTDGLQVGDELDLNIERVAHGGHCVGRHEGQVIFVRHTIPGERVRIRITKLAKRLAFADAVEVLVASSHRVTPPCSVAATCGGCDWQHVDVAYQREMKADVLLEQLQRIGKWIDAPRISVQPLSDNENGLGWRTRVEYATDTRGRAGFRQHASHIVVPVAQCPVAVSSVSGDGITNVPWQSNSRIRAVASATGDVVILPEGGGDVPIHEKVAEYDYELQAGNFWQGHKNAPETFVKEVLRMARITAGEHFVDLYAGAGLFSLPLAQCVGAGGRLDAVEGDTSAARSLKRNLKPQSQAHAFNEDVLTWLRKSGIKNCDAVVLDPPRVGAGKDVVRAISALKPQRVLYVACDPAALARDIAEFAEFGYTPTDITAWDAFPMTGHFETIVRFN